MRCSLLVLCIGVLLAGMTQTMAQSLRMLTLKQAEEIAAMNHPQIKAANLEALAARQVTTQIRSALFPTFFGSLTGADAADQSRLAAGGINNPIVLSRIGSGVTVNQLITDFGRTSTLMESSKLRSEAQQQSADATRAQVLLEVDRAYFLALRAQAVLKVAEETVKARQLIADQVTALANSKLKSELDVSFANVNLSEAKLLLVEAQNDAEAQSAQLATAMGYPGPQKFDLTEEPVPPAPPADVSSLVEEAIRRRPDVSSLRKERDASLMFAKAERDLWRPAISLQASAGLVPLHDQILNDRFGAFGLNVNIPIFNGHLYSARRAEASLKAEAANQNVRSLENRLALDVRVAWLNAGTAFQRLSLTSQLLDQAMQAQELAQARYDLGLSSIVELSQAQLNKTSAEIASATARYEYQIQDAALKYQIGMLR